MICQTGLLFGLLGRNKIRPLGPITENTCLMVHVLCFNHLYASKINTAQLHELLRRILTNVQAIFEESDINPVGSVILIVPE